MKFKKKKKKCEVLKKLGKVKILRGLSQSGWEQEGIWKAKRNQFSPTMTQSHRNIKGDAPASRFQPPSQWLRIYIPLTLPDCPPLCHSEHLDLEKQGVRSLGYQTAPVKKQPLSHHVICCQAGRAMGSKKLLIV